MPQPTRRSAGITVARHRLGAARRRCSRGGRAHDRGQADRAVSRRAGRRCWRARGRWSGCGSLWSAAAQAGSSWPCRRNTGLARLLRRLGRGHSGQPRRAVAVAQPARPPSVRANFQGARHRLDRRQRRRPGRTRGIDLRRWSPRRFRRGAVGDRGRGGIVARRYRAAA